MIPILIPVTLTLIPIPIPVTLIMISTLSLGFPIMCLNSGINTYYVNDTLFDALGQMFIGVTKYTASCVSQ